MRKTTIIAIIFLFCLSSLAIADVVSPRQGVRICGVDYNCQETTHENIPEAVPKLCPEIFGPFPGENGIGECVIDDFDCCNYWTSQGYNFAWNIVGEQRADLTMTSEPGNLCCGNNPGEYVKEERDSDSTTIDESCCEGVCASGKCAEDCSSTPPLCTPGTEHVIDNDNSMACCDNANDCVDDFVCYESVESAGICAVGLCLDLCTEDVSCTNTDLENGDDEVCYKGNWHDCDESEEYCNACNSPDYPTTWVAVAASLEPPLGETDDYNNDFTDGYCSGDDGTDVWCIVEEELLDKRGEFQNAKDVIVEVKKLNLKLVAETTTDEDGKFTVNLKPGTYWFIFTKARYITVTKQITISNPGQIQDVCARMYTSTECQPDCTKNDGYCYDECDGINDCVYPTYVDIKGDSWVGSQVCGYNPKQGDPGVRKGIIKEFGIIEEEGKEKKQFIECCTHTYTTTMTPVDVSSDIENIVTYTRIINYKGQLATMYITVAD